MNHAFYMDVAYLFAKRSHCIRKKVGALVVDESGNLVSVGWNQTLPGSPSSSCECHATGETTDYVAHAEEMALGRLLTSQTDTTGMTLYVTLSPCLRCSRLIWLAGITHVIYQKQYSCTRGLGILRQKGVSITQLE